MRKRTLLFRLRQWAALCLTLTLLLAMSALRWRPAPPERMCASPPQRAP